ncbi:MAG: prepilin-type N-terminal cleavage/methylation domain-containing protein [Candidatus Brocadiae bacterium]|nr:prepilin-type N-terminal cleavage/methylation domain-containing protein [Candidatus Brocadiia bacterium]
MRLLHPVKNTRRAGLTLVELVVVLFILVLLATVAVTSTDGLIDQSRHDATRASMTAWEEALIGPKGERLPDGSPWIRGFVADVGRLPVVLGDGSTDQELWTKPDALPAFAIASPAGDAEVRLPAGWRGPYLQLGVGKTRFRDGWDGAFEFRKADGAVAIAGDAAAILRSLGAGGTPGGVGYDADLSVTIHSSIAPMEGPRHLGQLTFRTVLPSPVPAGSSVVLRLYGPVNGALQTIAQWDAAAAAGAEIVLPAGGSYPATIGPRAVRAYLVTGGIPGSEDPIGAAPRSAIVPVTVVEGGLPEVRVEIP